MRDPTSGDDAAWTQRTPAYTRERMSDLFIKYHTTVANPPKMNKATRKFECGDKTCGAGYKSIQELERHYAEKHAPE